MSLTPHPEVNQVLDHLLPLWQTALSENLLGAYLRGSLALGDYQPGKSDLDFLVVLNHPLTDAELHFLQDWHGQHQQSGALPHLEGYYVDRASLSRLDFTQPIHGGLNTEYNLRREALKKNAVLECWIVRNCPLVLLGPDPRSLIPEVHPEDLRGAVREVLLNWSTPESFMGWLEGRGAQAYAIQTMCRALHTLHTGTLTSKPRAVEWVRGHLPHLAPLLDWSTENHGREGPDPEHLPHTLQLIRQVTRGQMPVE